ncbi:hypothetical protein R1T40_08195 [Tritonibacter scottomollicae]|uniref:Uncharacterized protein n=1 Tax=Tritonibacter scottomollicae TaxID=483013 RepID=A0ABZ0HKJ7_TRISK|nr:hypothetical protein R1T40_08195 [Tritonibacter scottomollicae]
MLDVSVPNIFALHIRIPEEAAIAASFSLGCIHRFITAMCFHRFAASLCAFRWADWRNCIRFFCNGFASGFSLESIRAPWHPQDTAIF